MEAMECVVVQDLFLNETANFAHVFLPGSSFLEKDGTFTNAERRISRVRKIMEPLRRSCRLGSHRAALERARLSDELRPSVRDHGRDRALTPTFTGVTLREDRSARQHPVAVQRRGAGRHADDARRSVRARQGQVLRHRIRADERAHHAPLPADPHDRPHPHPVQRRRADAPHAERASGMREDVLEIHPHDADVRGIENNDWVGISSRIGRDRAARGGLPRRSIRASSTPRSISRRPARTSSPPRTPTGRPTAPSTR